MSTLVEDLLSDYEQFEDHMRDIFKAMLAFDEDRSGKLSREELRSFLNAAGGCEAVMLVDDLVSELFSKSDMDNDGQLDFQEFILCFNKLVETRNAMGLPPIETEVLVTNHLERCFSVRIDRDTPDETVMSRNPAMSPKMVGSASIRKWKKAGSAIVAQQACVNMLIEIFELAKPVNGLVESQDLFEQMQNVGWLNKNTTLHNFNHQIPDEPPLAVLDAVAVVQMLYPDIKSRGKVLKLIENAKRYLKAQARNVQNSAKCQLYLDIKNNRKVLTEETKKEAMELFGLLDINGDKQLNGEEFVSMMSELYDRDTAFEMFEVVDVSNDNHINTWEFMNFWTMGITMALDTAEEYNYHLMGVMDGVHDDHDLDLLLRENSGVDVVVNRAKQSGLLPHISFGKRGRSDPVTPP